MENLDKEGVENTQVEGPTCGGKPKPLPPPGKIGDYSCIGDEWVWEDA